MSCDDCPVPGSCCRYIYAPIGDMDPIEAAKETPFNFIKKVGNNAFYSCPNLTPAGRCGDYENRPKVCHDTIEGEANCCVKSKIHLTEEQRLDMMNDNIHG